MTPPQVVSREEWLQARKELLVEEKELTRQRDRVNFERRQLPMVALEETYTFEGPDGRVDLLQLFDGRSQLIIYHFMFHPDWDEGCPSCSLMVDSIPHLSHLHAANTSLALVSRAPYPKLAAYRDRMGWNLPWYSSAPSEFNYDFHATLDPTIRPVEYNYRPLVGSDGYQKPIPEGGIEVPGTSVFLRDGETIYHTYSSYARGGDILLNTFNFLDLTPLGRQEPDGIMHWVRRHDEYEVGVPEDAYAD